MTKIAGQASKCDVLPLKLLLYDLWISSYTWTIFQMHPNNLDLFFFADPAFVISHPNTNSLNNTVNEELVKISICVITNKFTLNHDMSFYVMFGNGATNVQLNFMINGSPIARQNEEKFLGLFLDNLKLSIHIQHMKNIQISWHTI